MREESLYTFLSTGDKTAMYTLRLMVQVVDVRLGSFRKDEFVAILSNDYQKAVELAQVRSQEIGVPFNLAAAFDLNEIKRNRENAKSEKEREALEQAIKIQEEAQARYEADLIASILLIGKYKGRPIAEVAQTDSDYLHYMAGKYNPEAPVDAYKATFAMCAQWAEENPKQQAFWGVVGETLTERMQFITRFAYDGAYGRSWGCFFRTDNNATVVFYTTAKAFLALNEGDVVTLTGLIHKHDEKYNGDLITVVKKAKLA